MNTNGTLNFRLLGIPVSIHPFSWLMLLILGGGLGVDSGQQLAGVLLFVVAGMLCLLVHEMGHALAGRHLTGCLPAISIAGLGGLTYTPRLPRTRAGYFLYVFAGPLASLLLGLLGGLLFGLQAGDALGGIVFSLLYPVLGLEATLYAPLDITGIAMPLVIFYLKLFLVCFWWTVFNLLPIFPLDGGKLLGTLLNNDRLACIIGLVCGGALLALCLARAIAGSGSWFNVVIVGYLTYINYNCLRQM